MAENQGPGDISGYGKIEKTKGFDKETQIKPGQQDKFSSYMNEPTPGTKPEESDQLSPMELAKGATESGVNPTPASILNQIDNTQNRINEIKNNLNTPNLKFKHSQQRLLDNKLSSAKQHLQDASKTLGAPIPEEQQVPPGSSPVAKFLGYLTDGQNQMNSAKSELASLGTQKNTLTPAKFMLIQVKVAQAQQELEYSSVLLSKVIDSIKQMINIQI